MKAGSANIGPDGQVGRFSVRYWVVLDAEHRRHFSVERSPFSR